MRIAIFILLVILVIMISYINYYNGFKDGIKAAADVLDEELNKDDEEQDDDLY